ncbi:carboxypeptidase-like regulatory domain-containing protein [Chitinophaga sp. Cy-1792]|uniref:carboxypeptidase-like regulatory domain-containing protein n=1 Tax=Chitinophaga sp. Cy-1792 TaxID=2608339 RepID=UPI0014236CBA|nr:carboxypeptidase-like regulatory domain-containing protein [Chitinophaga sp. Cy-1792]NIG52451.1 carboxypeptidase regulatory-like domain-containing protein [Chitinophaga sp. Cy-1792]
MSKYLKIALSCCLFAIAACNKEAIPADYKPTPSGTAISSKQISAGVQGIVLDEKNQPVSGATVSCGNGTATTDQYGAFLIPKADMNEAAAVATVKKDGYFNGIRTFRVTGTGKIQFVQVQLLPKKIAGTFDASKGGTINASNAQFNFVSGQVLDANNKPYTGKASLLYAPINPEDASFASQLPGDLRAINSNNDEVGLKSYGMMALELQGENGEKLHLDGKQDVNFKMTIPAGLQASAPATIPLWHFDEADGLWKEEGEAKKSGDSYVGTVKHFSFWNCDAYFPLVNFKATFQDAKGAPLGNMTVTLTRADGNTSYAYTDAGGVVNGGVPLNESMTLKLLDKCNTVIYSTKVGPYAKDADLGIVSITLSDPGTITIKGQLTTCDNTPVKNGAVSMQLQGLTYLATVKNGTYQVTAIRCNSNLADATITAADLDADKSASQTIQVTTGAITQDLQACDKPAFGQISITIDGNAYSLNSITDTLVMRQYNATEYSFYGGLRTSGGRTIAWYLDDLSIGTRTPTDLYIYIGNTYYGASPNVQITVTQTGNKGEYIMGTISGTVTQPADSTAGIPSKAVPISGNFRMLRE